MDELEILRDYAASHGLPTEMVVGDRRFFVNPSTDQRIEDKELTRSAHYQGWRHSAYGIEPDKDIDIGLALQGAESFLEPDPVRPDLW